MNEMAGPRHIHDPTFAAANLLMEKLDGVFRDDEKRDAFELIYGTIRAAIEAAFAARAHEQARLNPCNN